MPRRCHAGRTCSSTISKCGGSSHSARCAAVSERATTLRPPLAVRARVAVAEPDAARSPSRATRKTKSSRAACRGSRSRAHSSESAPTPSAERCTSRSSARERQRIDLVDRRAAASASRSTTTWVSGSVEALARLVDDAALEPVRAARGMRRDDQLVGRERAQRVLDRLERVAVADLAARVDAGARASPRG